jgi:UDP-2,3-diacylglucosamine pyrophosphatase LpxH
MKKIKCEKSAFISDLHIPFHWKPTVDVVLEFLKWFQPDFVFIVGDLMDFYPLSNFDKNPQRLLQLQDELDQGVLFLKQLRKAVGRDCRIIFTPGN